MADEMQILAAQVTPLEFAASRLEFLRCRKFVGTSIIELTPFLRRPSIFKAAMSLQIIGYIATVNTTKKQE